MQVMHRTLHPVLLATMALVLSGCFMHTVIGDGMGTPSPDGRFTLAVSSHGAPRKAYVDLTKKRVYIWIMTKGGEKPEALFRGEYVCRGADLSWNTRWENPQKVTVDLFDYGDRILASDATKAGTPSNQILSLSFAMDSTGKWSMKN